MQNIEKTKARSWGYAILINEFEPAFRSFLANELLIVGYGNSWLSGIPPGIVTNIQEKYGKGIFQTPEEFMEKTNFSHLQEISVYSNNFEAVKKFVGDLPQSKFLEAMNELYELRNKIAHADRTFSFLDLERLIEQLFRVCHKGEEKRSKIVCDFVSLEKYRDFTAIPEGKILHAQETKCITNLPPEDYDLDTGFVGRTEYKRQLMSLLTTDLHRIITITGSGGVGKTALALSISYDLKFKKEASFDYIIWFSAKKNRLTETGIELVESQITNLGGLLRDILKIIKPEGEELLSSISGDGLKHLIYSLLKKMNVLLVIDNLETISEEADIIEFIKEIPRPTKVLITSRKGLGEVEKRFPIKELKDNEAIHLFRLISRERGLSSLVKLSSPEIKGLCNSVQNYPLAIKWSVGKVSLGKDISEAFNFSLSGESDIAKFSFEEIFNILSLEARKCLYAIVLFDNSLSNPLIKYLTELEEKSFEDAMEELILSSFVFPVVESKGGRIRTKYEVLSLTKDFVSSKLDHDEEIKNELYFRRTKLLEVVEQEEKSKTRSSQSKISLGIKGPEDQIALNYIKTAKEYLKAGDQEKAKNSFEEAVKVSPNFPYALIEYAKFESRRRHNEKSNQLMETAAKADPDNVHVWHLWGVIKRKQGEVIDSRECLERALKIDPKNPRVLNDLARTHTFLGEYELAEKYLESALASKTYEDTRHESIVHYNAAENYRRWSEEFVKRRDFAGATKKLTEAEKRVLQSICLSPNEQKGHDLLVNTYLDLANILRKNSGDFDEVKRYLLKCTENIQIGGETIVLKTKLKDVAYYYLAKMGIHYNLSKNEIMDFLHMAESSTTVSSRYHEKIVKLSNEIMRKDKEISGTISYFREDRKFGIIESGGETFLFFPSHILERVSGKISELSGRRVNFIPEKSPKNNKMMATQINVIY